MELLDSLWNRLGLPWPGEALVSVIVTMLAALAAHDNRVEFEEAEPELVLAEEAVPQPVVVEE